MMAAKPASNRWRCVLAVCATLGSLGIPACASQSSNAHSSPPASRDDRTQLSIGYSLLYQEADGIPKLHWLLMFKKKTAQMARVTQELIDYYRQLAASMQTLSKERRDLHIDVDPLPDIEAKSREAIGKDLAKDIAPVIGKGGIDFEREILLTFYDGLNEQRHLVQVMLPLESDPVLRRFLEETQVQLDAYHARIGALLNQRYFRH